MISVHLQFANNCTTTYSASSPITNYLKHGVIHPVHAQGIPKQ